MRELHPAGLPPGTVVGPWRVVHLRGQGTYGAVYRAVRVGREELGPVALKLAVSVQDERFEREAELLERLQHPSIPRLLDHGRWQQPTGVTYPFLVMEWVEGTPLYDWAREHNPSSRRAALLLAQLASALATTHAAASVHRDVKGDNVLVRHGDSRAVLMDFGAGNYQGARPLTDPPLIPGTSTYRAPEALLFRLRSYRLKLRYEAGPADDVFALGLTAYRLVTGEYPPPAQPREDEAGTWHLNAVAPPPPVEFNPRVDPRLSILIHRMLSMSPEERGTAGDLAEALEQAAEQAGPEADQPLFTPETQAPSTWDREDAAFAAILSHRLRPELLGNAARLRPLRRRRRRRGAVAPPRAHLRAAPLRRAAPREHAPAWRLLLTMVTAVALPLLCSRRDEPPPSVEMPAMAEATPDAGAPDAGSVALGDATLTAPGPVLRTPSGTQAIALDSPPKPIPGQFRPDVNGRCPGKVQVVLNGACWLKLDADPDDCKADNGYVYRGSCYLPAFPRQRQPTSTPPDSR